LPGYITLEAQKFFSKPKNSMINLSFTFYVPESFPILPFLRRKPSEHFGAFLKFQSK